MTDKINTKFDICTVLRKMLLEDEEIKQYVDNKIFPIVAPQNTKGNFIVYARDSYSINTTKMGIYNQECEVFISCLSDDYDISNKMANAVFQCLNKLYRRTIDGKFINSIELKDSTEDYANDMYIQTLLFSIK